MASTPIILCDLDSTLSNTSKRAHLATSSTEHADWIPYSQACRHDAPIAGPVAAIKALSKIYPLYIVSGRNIEAYWETVDWLSEHGIVPHGIKLRSSTDIAHNGEYKVDYIAQLRERNLDPIVMFEDHDGVADMVEAIGVPVVRVKPGYADVVGVRFNHLETDAAPA